MALLDAIQLFLVSEFTHKDQDEFAGRICNATLQFIAQLDGLEACYVSKHATENELWIFLVSKDAANREEFLDSTIGVGVMMPFLRKAPRIYSFAESVYDFLEDGANIKLSLHDFEKKLSDADMTWFEQSWKALWEPQTAASAWQNEGEAASFLSLTVEAKGLPPAALNSRADAPQYTFREQVISVERFDLDTSPNTQGLPLPTTAAELLRSDPRLYGDVPYDESGVGTTAQIHGITFRSMENIGYSSWFDRDEDEDTIPKSFDNFLSQTTLHYAHDYPSQEPPNLHAILQDFSTKSGLLDLRWFRDEHSPHIMCVLAAWRKEADYRAFESRIPTTPSPLTDPALFSRAPEHATFPVSYPPSWDSDTVEILTFEFPDASLEEYERKAFKWYLYKFINTMEIDDADDPETVQHYGPWWETDKRGVLFLAWKSLGARKAWIQNFLAHGYGSVGYFVHGVALSGARVEGQSVEVRKVDWIGLKYGR